jgi:hypothetical protein
MDESIQLNPKVKVSDLDLSSLPLRNFHIVVVVEPDPETWAMPDDDTENLSKLLKMYSELIIDDAIGEVDTSAITVPISRDVEKTFLIMAGEGFGGYYHFRPVVEYSDFIVNTNNYEFEKLCLLLDGIAKNYPTQNRVGIVGGMYGDEIVRAANAVQSLGFDTTIVTRYCISEKVFINLDEMFDFLNAERKRLLGDLWMGETDDDFDEEFDDE